MNGAEWVRRMEATARAVKALGEERCMADLGEEAERFFKGAFRRQGWTDGGLRPWKEVNRREDPANFRTITKGKRKGEVVAKNISGKAKILVGTGTLSRGFGKELGGGGGSVTVYNDVPYAAAHNEGTQTAGRGRRTTIPQRQFMGDSRELEAAMERRLLRRLEEIEGGKG